MTRSIAHLIDRLRRQFGGADRQTAPIAARIPDGQLVYAVGDIHGERALLDRLLRAILDDAAANKSLHATVIFLGDYVDRGGDSCGVLDVLSDLPNGDVKWRFLRGNHEQAMLDFLVTPEMGPVWLRFGGVETLASYGLLAPAGVADPRRLKDLADGLAERLPLRHLAFLQATEMMIVQGDYIFAHAGIDPGRPLDQQRPDDLLWIRDGFIDRPHRGTHVVVHGHTIVDIPIIDGNRIALDTGAYATGRLTAVALHGLERRILQVTG